MLTNNTKEQRRNIWSLQDRFWRRLDPLNRQQQLHPLRHPAVLLSLVVVLQPFLLRQVHVATVAAVFSIWSENCGLLFAEAALKEEGRGRGLNLYKKLIPSRHFNQDVILTSQMAHTSSCCGSPFFSILAIALIWPSSMLWVYLMMIQCARKEDGQRTTSPTSDLRSRARWPLFLNQTAFIKFDRACFVVSQSI